MGVPNRGYRACVGDAGCAVKWYGLEIALRTTDETRTSSFITKGDDGVDAGRAAGRQKASTEARKQEQRRR